VAKSIVCKKIIINMGGKKVLYVKDYSKYGWKKALYVKRLL
jgi:deoxycytidylate deaminase